MELENIVANTVYLKARESEYRVSILRKWRSLLRPKACALWSFLPRQARELEQWCH